MQKTSIFEVIFGGVTKLSPNLHPILLRHLAYTTLLAASLLLPTTSLVAQTLGGRVMWSSTEGIPQATIYIKELQLGTSTNNSGYFDLKLPAGVYTVVFKSIGYASRVYTCVVPAEGLEITVQLEPRRYEILNTDSIAPQEDAAYRIMRYVIGMAPFYHNQIAEYHAESYVKGSIKINKISGATKTLAGRRLERMHIKPGSVMVMESVNEIRYQMPDELQHKVISTNNSLPEEWNQMNSINFMAANLYASNVVATDAFSNYTFEYRGTSQDGAMRIHRIKVSPRSKNPILLAGYIYIAEGSWHIHSVDLRGILPLGAYTIQALTQEVYPSVYMPASYHLQADLNILGNKGQVDYTTTMHYKAVQLNTQLPNPLLPASKLTLMHQQLGSSNWLQMQYHTRSRNTLVEEFNEMVALLAKGNMDNHDMTRLAKLAQHSADETQERRLNLNHKYKIEVDPQSSKSDTGYWSQIRPLPLSYEEALSYREIDSVRHMQRHFSQTGSERVFSVVNSLLIRNKFKLGNNFYLHYGGLLDPFLIAFNAVDGFRYGQALGLSKRFANDQALRIDGEGIWAFGRNKWIWELKGNYLYAPQQRGSFYAGWNCKTTDYNHLSDITDLSNSLEPLFMHNNGNRFYEQYQVQVGHSIDIVNGLQLDLHANYFERRKLGLSTNFSLRSLLQSGLSYEPNVPLNTQLQYIPELQKAGIVHAELHYTPEYYYRMQGRQKIMSHSIYPTFSIAYTKGVHGWLGSEVDFDMARLRVEQNLPLGLMRQFKYFVEGAKFFNAKVTGFQDFYQFPVFGFSIVNFIDNLGYSRLYRYATNDWGMVGSARYTTPFLALKYIPGLDNRYFRENVQVSFVYAPHDHLYSEVQYIISEVFFILELGFFVGFENASVSSIGFSTTYTFPE